MSLLTQMMEDCVLYNRSTVPDGYGGYKYDWTPGVTFMAAVEKSSTAEQMLAEQKGVSEAFTVVTERSMSLDYHDVFVRKSDDAIFRITSKPQQAHPASTVKIAKLTAEQLEAMPSATNS